MKTLLEQCLRKELKEQLLATFTSLEVPPTQETSTVEQAPGMFPGMSSVGLTTDPAEPSEEECSMVVADIVAECRRARK